MTNPEPGANAASSTMPSLPVICDTCRAEGLAGDAGFVQIADILNFEPVPRGVQVNNWTAEHQRAFIAALAITGSAAAAARALGRHARGVEKLRKARGGKGFAEAWDAALEIARERELARLQENMAELSRGSEAAGARYEPGPVTRHEPAPAGRRSEPAWGSEEALEEQQRRQRESEEAQERIRERLLRARRLLLMLLAEEPEKQRAWEVLVGPVDWDKARAFEPQDNEPFTVTARDPDMVLTVEAGLLPDITGGPDGLAEVKEIWRQQAEERAQGGGEG